LSSKASAFTAGAITKVNKEPKVPRRTEAFMTHIPFLLLFCKKLKCSAQPSPCECKASPGSLGFCIEGAIAAIAPVSQRQESALERVLDRIVHQADPLTLGKLIEVRRATVTAAVTGNPHAAKRH